MVRIIWCPNTGWSSTTIFTTFPWGVVGGHVDVLVDVVAPQSAHAVARRCTVLGGMGLVVLAEAHAVVLKGEVIVFLARVLATLQVVAGILRATPHGAT